MFERTINLIGTDNFNKISNLNILLVGLGGVGSFVFESLIRAGVNNLTIADYDVVTLSNINRQLVANLNTVNSVEVPFNV